MSKNEPMGSPPGVTFHEEMNEDETAKDFADGTIEAQSFDLELARLAVEQQEIERFSEEHVKSEWVLGYHDSGDSFEISERLLSEQNRVTPLLEVCSPRQGTSTSGTHRNANKEITDEPSKETAQRCQSDSQRCRSSSSLVPSQESFGASTDVGSCSNWLSRRDPHLVLSPSSVAELEVTATTSPNFETGTRRPILWFDTSDDDSSSASYEPRSLEPQLLQQLLVLAQVKPQRAKETVLRLCRELEQPLGATTDSQVIPSKDRFEELLFSSLKCTAGGSPHNISADLRRSFRTVLQFYSARAALIVLFINWTNLPAYQGVPIQLGQRLNVPNTLHTTTVFTILRCRQLTGLAGDPPTDLSRVGGNGRYAARGRFGGQVSAFQSAHKFMTSQAHEPLPPGCGSHVQEGGISLADFKNLCALLATGFQGDIQKASGSGKSLIIDGKCIDPQLFGEMFPASGFWLAKRSRQVSAGSTDNTAASTKQSGVVVVPCLLMDSRDLERRGNLDESVTRYLKECRDCCFCIDPSDGESHVVDEIHSTVVHELQLAHEAGVF